MRTKYVTLSDYNYMRWQGQGQGPCRLQNFDRPLSRLLAFSSRY